MTDKKICTFTVYKDETTNTVFWDADLQPEKGEDWFKILKMLHIAEGEVLDIIIKNSGVHLDESNIHRRAKSEN
jgi:hypothetical protein